MAGRTTPGGARTRTATIADRRDLTPALAFFHLRCDSQPWAFVPGQYLTLGIEAAAGLVQRPYSIASSARRIEDGYELYVRLLPGGALTPLLFGSRPGQLVRLREPKGRFVLRPGDDRVHVFVATGCGIAPFMSMLRTMRDDGSSRSVVLLHGVSYVRELAYRTVLEELSRDVRWQLTYVPTISRPHDPANASWRGRTGRVEHVLSDVWRHLRLMPDSSVAYVCGATGMIGALKELLRERGLPPGDIHEERYWPAGPRGPGPTT